MAQNDDLQSKASDLVKKILTVGVGAAFLTEEGLRALVSEIKLPKELITGILESAGKTKNDFLSKIGNDVVEKVTSRMEPDKLVRELLERNELELHVRLRFKPRSKDFPESPQKEDT